MDGVDPPPGPGRVRRHPAHVQDQAQGPVAAALDPGRRGLPQHRQVPRQPVGVGRQDPSQAVEVGGDLLVVVQDPGDVLARVGQGGRQVEGHGHPALHVHAAAPPDHLLAVTLLAPPGHVAAPQRDGHGVQVPGHHHALRASQVGAGHHRVAVTQHLQVVQVPQGGLDGVRQRPLRARDAGDVHQRLGDVGRGTGQVRQADGCSGVGGAHAVRVTVRGRGRVLRLTGGAPPGGGTDQHLRTMTKGLRS